MTPVEALQAALAGEHAAVYLYGLLGGRVSAYDAPHEAAAVAAAYAVHRGRRDELLGLVRRLGGDPVPTAVGYSPAGPVESLADVRRVARDIESRCAQVYAQATASTTGAARRWAVDALADAAVRALSFGARPTAFPGLPEL